MKKNWSIWLPAIVMVLVSIGLIVYSQLHTSGGPSGEGPRPGQGFPNTGQRPERDGEGASGIFKLLGTFSLVVGAVSFSWFAFKKKLKSPSQFIKKLGRLLYKIHTYTGWAALVLVLIHGIYYLFTKFGDHRTLSGIAAALIILTLAGYGLFIRRVKYKYMRKIHLLLATVWIPILFIHAGGQVIATTAATLAAWALVWVIDRQARPVAATSK